MRIGLVGNIVVDEITTSRGNLVKSWGGAYYSLATFQKIMLSGEKVIPLTPIGYDIWDDLMAGLEKLDKIDVSAPYRSSSKNNKVFLTFIDQNDRNERANYIAGIKSSLSGVEAILSTDLLNKDMIHD